MTQSFYVYGQYNSAVWSVAFALDCDTVGTTVLSFLEVLLERYVFIRCQSQVMSYKERETPHMEEVRWVVGS